MKIFSDINKRDGIRSETYNKEYTVKAFVVTPPKWHKIP